MSKSILLALILTYLVQTCVGFKHQKPSEFYVVKDSELPNDASESNTYDYIFVGAGATSSVHAAKMMRDSGCQLKILMIESGRSYQGDEPECGSEIDCYVRYAENKYHEFPGAQLSAPVTRSSWPFESRVAQYSEAISFSDGRDISECPAELTGPDIVPPLACACTSDINVGLTPALCSTTGGCLAANGGDTNVCGELVCPPEICAKQGRNLYYRSSSKGGSNTHHAMYTYKMSPWVAGLWKLKSGSNRYTWSEWERAFKEYALAPGSGGLAYTSNPMSPHGTVHNDTFKELFRRAAVEEEGVNDLTGVDRPTNAEEFFDATNPDQKYFQSFVQDTVLGRQVTKDGFRATPALLLEAVMAECSSTFEAKCGALATKLLFADRGNRLSRTTIGVEFIDGYNNHKLDMNFNQATADARLQSPMKAYARRGVIVAAGAFPSPQLLMLSGIGDEEQLNRFNIPVRKHLPAVGKNLRDDTENTIHYKVTANGDPLAANGQFPGYADIPAYVPGFIKALFGFDPSAFSNTTGFPVSAPGTGTACHSAAGAFTGGKVCPTIPNTNITVPDDFQYLRSLQNNPANPSFYRDAPIASKSMYFTTFRDELERFYRKNPTCLSFCTPGFLINGWYDGRGSYAGTFGSTVACDSLTASGGLLSRGVVELRSDKPYDPPIIDPNSFKFDIDLVSAGKCANNVRRIVDKMNAISAANPTLYGGMTMTEFENVPFGPGSSVSKTEVTEELKDYLRKSVWHHHPQGSNQMGTINNPNSVVDDRGRVWGMRNLYVIDTSSFPSPVDFFPSGPAMAYGWLQAEEMLRRDELLQESLSARRRGVHQHHVRTEEGAGEGEEFMDPQGPEELDAEVVEPGVSEGFRTATIVLSIAAGILLVVVLVLIVMRFNKGRPNYTRLQQTGRRVRSYKKY